MSWVKCGSVRWPVEVSFARRGERDCRDRDYTSRIDKAQNWSRALEGVGPASPCPSWRCSLGRDRDVSRRVHVTGTARSESPGTIARRPIPSGLRAEARRMEPHLAFPRNWFAADSTCTWPTR